MDLDRLPGPIARLGSGARVAVAVVGIALGVGLIVLGGRVLEGDDPTPDSLVVPTTEVRD